MKAAVNGVHSFSFKVNMSQHNSSKHISHIQKVTLQNVQLHSQNRRRDILWEMFRFSTYTNYSDQQTSVYL